MRPEARLAERVARQVARAARAARRRSTARARRAVRRAAPRRSRSRGDAVASGSAWWRARRCGRPRPESSYFSASAIAAARLVVTPVANARRTCPPGAMRTRRRRLRIGSSTAPVRARERPAVERDRVLGRAPAADEARAVGLPLDRAVDAVLDAQHVHRPRGRLVGRARAATAQQRGALGTVLGLEEQLEERRVGEIVGGRREHDLDQARHLDLAQAVAAVDQRDAPHLDVVLGRHRDLEPGLDAVVRAVEHAPRRRGSVTR